ncbi:GyrI-like domain-containing protein [Roseivirga echinicomitans]|uniref:GyrI-like domain-containing protein n=1 Tax=Roseivirga echinicomitans TaxID=296218 RepID=UPI0021D0591F|nr:GyrI-like domain-containing protein [Roseivirga echinicomitans]
MSLTNNRAHELWSSFMPRRKEIVNALNSNFISMQVYSEPLTLGQFDQVFEKWAGVEVLGSSPIPEGMENFNLEEGLYAVFDYKGSSTATKFSVIFSEPGFQNRIMI